MADDAQAPDDAAASSPQGEEVRLQEIPAGPRSRLRDYWLAPTLLLGVVLLVAGLVAVRRTAPGPDFPAALRDAERLIEAHRVTEALDLLNNVVRPQLTHPSATAEIRGRFHALRADALYFAQQEKGLADPRNFDAIVNEYQLARERLDTLEPAQLGRLADSLIALGRMEEAAEIAQSLSEEHASLRRDLYKKIVSANLQSDNLRYDLTLELLTRLAANPGQSERERLWTTTRLASLMLEANRPEQALERLLREAQRFETLEGEPGAQLLTLLGKAYYKLGRFREAREQLERAVEMLPDTEPLRAEAETYLGRALQTLGHAQEARDQFAHVVAAHPHSLTAPLALLGLGETEALLGGFDQALDAYRQLVQDMRSGRVSLRITPLELATRSLLEQAEERQARGDLPNALAFAQLAEQLHKETPQAAVDIVVARLQRRIADGLLAQQNASPDDPLALARVDPVTLVEARAHYADAADHFLRHARAVLLEDNDAFAESLWQAAESYDYAGAADKAVEVYSEYLRAKPDDPREPQALLRLAQLQEALNNEQAAEGLYAELFSKHPNAPEGVRAMVALARMRLGDSEESNDAVAEQQLLRVLSGELLTPQSQEYREALLTLADHLLRSERFEEAIERFSEALTRYPDDPQIVSSRYKLAEALRRSAEQMQEQLREAMPESQRRELEQLRRQRLAQAMGLYEQVREALEQHPEDGLSDLDRRRLRNAYFYRADAAFDLGEYDTAIRLYDAAAQRYARDPASLVALAQIVAAYLAKGDLQAARTAQERARARFLELPDDAFARDDLTADRAFWEQWLQSRLTLADVPPQGRDAADGG